MDGEKALLHVPRSARPEIIEIDEVFPCWNGKLIVLSSQASLTTEFRKFDFTWFITAVVICRKLLSEVLLVSFVLQLFALLTRLFFQVLMDNVLVHRRLATPDVISMGLLGVMLFETVLSGFHALMRELPELLKQHPTCQGVIVGGDGVSYGSPQRCAQLANQDAVGEPWGSEPFALSWKSAL